MRGHRTSILGVPTFVRKESRTLAPTQPMRYTLPPEWRQGPGDPNIKRKWLMHIEDERGSNWRLPGAS